MTLAVWFWGFYVISLVFGLYSDYVPGQPYPYNHGARSLLFYVLVGILGYAVFGGPVK